MFGISVRVGLLVAAAVLALPALTRFRGGGYYSAWRRAWLTALRLGAVAALVAAAALSMPARPGRPDLIVLADVSASIPAEKAAAREAFIAQLRRERPAADGPLRVVRFAAAPLSGDGVALPAGIRTGAAAVPAAGAVASAAEGTGIAAALEAGRGLVAPGRRAVLLLLSDGEENEGSAAAALEGLRRDGVEVLVHDLSAAGVTRPAIVRVSAPRRVIPLERFEIGVAVAGGPGERIAVRLAREGEAGETRDGSPDARREREVTFALQAPRAGTLRLRLRLEDDAGRPLPAGERVFEVRVAPPPPVTLLTENPPESRLAREVFAGAGLPVTLASPEEWRMLPDAAGSPGVVVLDNVPAQAIGAEGIAKIERLVRERGAGLLVFGGMQSLGAGGYGDTGLEQVLPVAMEAPSRGADADLALVVVLDTSLSMYFQGRPVPGAAGPGPRKIELAKAAILEIAEALRPADQIGLLSSDDRLVWVRRPAPLGDRGDFEARVRRLVAIGGGINFYSSIREAFEALRGSGAKIRHVMVLADANDIDQVEVENAGRSVELVRQMAAERVTLSIFALGFPSDKDVAFLRQMTRLGRGDFYLVANALSLPRYFRSEYQKKTGEEFREEAFAPLVRNVWPALRGLDTDRLPELEGMNLVAVKGGAEEVLVSPSGAPVLAHWRYGRGRTAVFAGDGGERWSRAWFAWGEAGRFWPQFVHELAPPAPPDAVEASARRDGARLLFQLRPRDGAALPLGEVTATFEPPGASSRLERAGVSLFEARLPEGADRGALFRLTGEPLRGRGEVGGGFDLPPAAEYRPPGRGPALLDAIAAATGGARVRDAAEVAARGAAAGGGEDPGPRLFWLFLAGLLCLFGEALLRH